MKKVRVSCEHCGFKFEAFVERAPFEADSKNPKTEKEFRSLFVSCPFCLVSQSTSLLMKVEEI